MRATAWLLVVLSAFGLAVVHSTEPDVYSSVTLGAILTSVLGLSSVVLMSPGGVRKSLSSFRLGPWMALSFTVQYGLVSLLWLGEMPLGFIFQIEWIPKATVVAFVGWMGLLAGYRTILPITFNRLRSKPDLRAWQGGRRVVSMRGLLWLCALAGVGILVSLLGGSFGYTSDGLEMIANPTPWRTAFGILGSLQYLAIMIAFSQWARTGQRIWGTAAKSLLTIVLIIGFVQGAKSTLVLPIVMALMGWSFAARRLPIKRLLLLAIVYVTILAPLITGYRYVVNQGGTSRLTTQYVIQNLPEVAISSFEKGQEQSFTDTLWRFNQVAMLSPVPEFTPELVPFSSPTELLVAPVVFAVPRAVWPSKPVLDIGKGLTEIYYFSNVPSASAITPFGDLYRHGGWVVLILGGWVIGLMTQVVDRFSAIVRWPLGSIVTASFFYTFIRLEVTAIEIFVAIPGTILTIILAWKIVNATADRGSASASGGRTSIARQKVRMSSRARGRHEVAHISTITRKNI